MINKPVKTYCNGKPNYILDKQMNNEPVAHFYPEGEGCTVFSSNFVFKYQGTKKPIPLYTHPAKEYFEDEPQAEELFEIMKSNETNNKPVAWMQTWENQDGELKHTVNIEQIGKNDIPLYTHPANPKYDPETGEPLIDGYPLFSGLPPEKTLTDEEIAKVAKDFYLSEYVPYDFARAILRKAQE